MSTMDWETLRRLIAASERLSIGSYFLDVSGDCQSPGRRTVSGLPPRSYGAWLSNSGSTVSLLRGWGTWAEPMFDRPMPITLSISARCRKCAACLASRRRLWQARVAAEVRYSERSWFGTLTFRPELQYFALSRAERRQAFRGVLDPTAAEQFRDHVRELSPEVTRWLKRVRKNSRARLRYVLVWEPHKSGYPHAHCVVHQSVVDEPVTYRHLADAYTAGYCKFNLISTDQGAVRAGRYVAKYLTKSVTAGARVRASLRYGLPSQTAVHALLSPGFAGDTV